MLQEISSGEARRNFADLMSRVAFGKMRFRITRHKKPVVAMISAEDYELFEFLLDRFSDQIDAVEVPKAMNEADEKGLVSFDDLAEELGI